MKTIEPCSFTWMSTLSGGAGVGVIVPEMVMFWPGIRVAPTVGLENVIEPVDVEVRRVAVDDVVVLVVVDGRAVVVVTGPVERALTEADDDTVWVFVFIARRTRLAPTSSTTRNTATFSATDPSAIPIAGDTKAPLIVKD
jgi:hypothetical protein